MDFRLPGNYRRKFGNTELLGSPYQVVSYRFLAKNKLFLTSQIDAPSIQAPLPSPLDFHLGRHRVTTRQQSGHPVVAAMKLVQPSLADFV